MSQIWNVQFVLGTQHKSDDETRYGGTQRSERFFGGTYEEFARNLTALRKAGTLPWIRPCITTRKEMRHFAILASKHSKGTYFPTIKEENHLYVLVTLTGAMQQFWVEDLINTSANLQT